MATLNIEQLLPGMKLAQPLKKGNRMLLPKGAELNSTHIELLQRLQVEQVAVEDGAACEDAHLISDCAEYAKKFFIYADMSHPAVLTLHKIATINLIKSIKAGGKLLTDEEIEAVNVEHLRDTFFSEDCDPQSIFKAETEAASFPDTYIRIKKVLDNPESSATDIAKAVSMDVALTAKILKLVNSPMYGFPSSIDSISRAVAMIGAKEVSILALGLTSIGYFKNIPKELMDMKSFWIHSISCGILSKILAKKITKSSGERFFISGLLHDVGRLLLFKHMPYSSSEAILLARGGMMPLMEAEQAIFGFDHSAMTKKMMTDWNFPKSLLDVAPFHHNPLEAGDPMSASILHIAELVTGALGIAEGGVFVLPNLDPKAWHLTKLAPQDLFDAAQEHDEQLEELKNAFLN